MNPKMIKTVGSVCSGIEAASVSWQNEGLSFKWFSEIADFPSKVLKDHYPDIPNVGDMKQIPSLLINGKIDSPDLICGGTPCQAFSWAGFREGLEDERGNLTLVFADIINANDSVREKAGKPKTIVFWENVEGVLTDKTNAFGCLVSYLAGLSEPIEREKWEPAGAIFGPKRNVAWRVLDAKFFGVPQQRKRLYVIAGGKDFHPENVLFEQATGKVAEFPKKPLVFEKSGHSFEVFREFTDCLYAAYGTKWNGNAAATNGSLFVVQDGEIRRVSPLEGERLMGFPDNYTNIKGSNNTRRFQAVGNSWAVPVVRFLGQRIKLHFSDNCSILADNFEANCSCITKSDYQFYEFDKAFFDGKSSSLNLGSAPNTLVDSDLKQIIDPDAGSELYISPVGCYGIIRRKNERNLTINKRLEEVLLKISSRMAPEEIERRSLVQNRGAHSLVQKK
jgi:DNA (cytosine-5)-methyltransferase 1